MIEDSDNQMKKDFNVSIDEAFQHSEIYINFGTVNVNQDDYTLNVSIIISASEDIEVAKVIDFLKDYIPSQFNEAIDQKILLRFQFVNNKISEVLSQTLENNSFIEVALAYVLIKNDLFYVSLDDGYELSISRGEKTYNIRNEKIDTIDGSGKLELGDKLNLYFKEERVLYWTPVEEPIIDEIESPIIIEEPNEDIKQHIEEPDDINKNTSIEKIEINDEKPNLKNKIQSIFLLGLKNVGEAFSFIIALIFRGKKAKSLSKALPNKSKGFLILGSILFLIVLLGLFIKSAGEDNKRKQQEQSYKDSITALGKEIKDVEASSASISLGDPSLTAKVTSLKSDLQKISDNPLKIKTNSQKDVDDDQKEISSIQDRIDGVIRIDESSVLSRFGGFITNANPSGFTLRDSKIYTTDLTSSKVFVSDSNSIGSPTAFVTEGLAKPVGIEFTKNKLLVLDQGNGIYELDTNTKNLIKVAGYDIASETSTSIKSYYDKDVDNFYLLQPTKKAIQRIPGLGNGNFAVATKYNKDDFPFEPSDFSIIGGSAYITDSSGNVTKYTRNNSTGATPDPFQLPTLQVPIGTNAKIAGMTPRDSGVVYLFVSDPTNDRILIFDNKDPNNVKFVAQYKPSDDSIFDFKNIKGLILDESDSKVSLYALSTYGIFKINVNVK